MSPSRATKYGHLKVILGAKREGHWVHRLVLRAFVREPRSGEVARHLNGDPTDNRLLNLTWGTSRENNRDRAAHGTAKGELNPAARLTEAQVLNIFALRGKRKQRAVAAEYGVGASTICAIWKGDAWGWLTSA